MLISSMTAGCAVAAEPIPVAIADPVEIDADAEHRHAVDCLALAISYEAGQEPVLGQQAVAEVILNRVRNPGFPKTVCGVVFAGSTHHTGCQFTFTCDGSLLRRMPTASLARSRDIAERVLSGSVTPVVPGATHYHAAYVSPYWAPSLVRLVRIGLHIFYRAPTNSDGALVPGLHVAGGEMPATVLAAMAGVTPFSGSLSVPRATGRAPADRPRAFSPWGL